MQKKEPNIINEWLDGYGDEEITNQVEEEIKEFMSVKEFTYEDMLAAARYGYNFHKDTMFPEQEFEDSCIRNTQQWLTTFYDEYPLK